LAATIARRLPVPTKPRKPPFDAAAVGADWMPSQAPRSAVRQCRVPWFVVAQR
jgi:hypothetical protein